MREALLVSRASTLVCGDDDLADRTDGRLVSLSIVGRVSFLAHESTAILPLKPGGLLLICGNWETRRVPAIGNFCV